MKTRIKFKKKKSWKRKLNWPCNDRPNLDTVPCLGKLAQYHKGFEHIGFATKKALQPLSYTVVMRNQMETAPAADIMTALELAEV